MALAGRTETRAVAVRLSSTGSIYLPNHSPNQEDVCEIIFRGKEELCLIIDLCLLGVHVTRCRMAQNRRTSQEGGSECVGEAPNHQTGITPMT